MARFYTIIGQTFKQTCVFPSWEEGNKKEAVKWDNGLDTIQDINSI